MSVIVISSSWEEGGRLLMLFLHLGRKSTDSFGGIEAARRFALGMT